MTQINLFRPTPSHSATDSQYIRFCIQIFSWYALARGPEKKFPPGNEPALGGHKNTVYLVSKMPNSYATKIAAVSLRLVAHYYVPVDQGTAPFKDTS
jgi:hypothetical protein